MPSLDRSSSFGRYCKGADPRLHDANGYIPLHVAALHRRFAAIHVLVHACPDTLRIRDGEGGRDPLFAAIEETPIKELSAVVQLLTNLHVATTSPEDFGRYLDEQRFGKKERNDSRINSRIPDEGIGEASKRQHLIDILNAGREGKSIIPKSDYNHHFSEQLFLLPIFKIS